MREVATTKGGVLAGRNKASQQMQTAAHMNVGALMNTLLSKEGYQKRFQELLGQRAPQFIGSLVSMVNDGDERMMEAFKDSPISIIKSALRAASYDLPIDPMLGQAYIVPFRNAGKMEATFIIGYKGLYQLAVRTGVYKKINVVDVREGEYGGFNRLTEDIELHFIEDEEEREKAPIIGYCGYFEMTNGFKKTIYMSRKEINAHELKFRKGKYMGKGWKENWEAMAMKTVLRRLLGKWGLLSITYQKADAGAVRAAEAMAAGNLDDDDEKTIEAEAVQEARVDNPETGEVTTAAAPEETPGLELSPEDVAAMDAGMEG